MTTNFAFFLFFFWIKFDYFFELHLPNQFDMQKKLPTLIDTRVKI